MILSNIASLVLYFTLFFLVLVLSYLSFVSKKKIFAVFAIFIPVILVALRYHVGTDTENYKDIFDALNDQSFSSAIAQAKELNFEPFTILAARLSNRLGFSYFFFFFSHSLIAFVALYFSSRYVSPQKPWLFYGIFTLVMLPYCLNTMRQAAATAIFTLLLLRIFYKPSEWLKNSLLFILMVSCHFSSALLIPVLILCMLAKKVKPKNFFLITSAVITLFIVSFPFVLSLAKSFSLIPLKYLALLEDSGSTLLNFDFLIFLTISLAFLITRKFKNRESSAFNIFTASIILCNLFYAGIGFYSWYIGRMSDYFWPFATIGIWLLIDKLNDKDFVKHVVYLGFMFIYFIITSILLNNNGIFPYGVML